MNVPGDHMRRFIAFCGLELIILLAALLAGCNLPSSVAGAGPSVWIDYPADGMTFSSGALVVQSHSTGPNAISQAELYVNDSLARTDLNSDSAERLVAMSQPWVPPGPGVYTLEVRARDAQGNAGHSLPVHITIGNSVLVPSTTPNPGPGATATASQTPGAVSPAPAACLEPTASLTLNGNCRAGPGTDYDPVDVLLAGTSVRIVGRTEDSGWWQVQRPGGGTCWLSAVAVSTCGNLQTVIVIAPPAPPAAQPPQPPAASKPASPGKLSVTKHVCAGSTYSVTLGWNDAADNEDGYRVYRGNALLETLGAGAVSYTDSPPVGGPYTYRVEAFNAAGASNATTQDAGCIF